VARSSIVVAVKTAEREREPPMINTMGLQRTHA